MFCLYASEVFSLIIRASPFILFLAVDSSNSCLIHVPSMLLDFSQFVLFSVLFCRLFRNLVAGICSQMAITLLLLFRSSCPCSIGLISGVHPLVVSILGKFVQLVLLCRSFLCFRIHLASVRCVVTLNSNPCAWRSRFPQHFPFKFASENKIPNVIPWFFS